MTFNPEDELTTAPRCRSCHKGSSGCGACHNEAPGGLNANLAAADDNVNPATGYWRSSITDLFMMLMNPAYPHEDGSSAPYSAYDPSKTSTSATANNGSATLNVINKTIGGTAYTADGGILKNSRTVSWSADLRTTTSVVAANCSDDGLSWPHRTLGWKMLKDDLFGIDVGVAGDTDKSDSEIIGVNQVRAYNGQTTHDIDSVCLDCHNPTIWNATSTSDHTDDLMNPSDDADDDLLLRGLP